MKGNVPGASGEDEAQELTVDIAILFQLSTMRDVKAKLARERDMLLAAIASGRPAVEEPLDRARVDAQRAALSLRLEALEGEYAAADERKRQLVARLSPDVRRLYSSLSAARRPPFIVALEGDCCGGCNMRLPSGLVADILRARRLHHCPSCKRVLFPSALKP